jgi:hypothetical protein
MLLGNPVASGRPGAGLKGGVVGVTGLPETEENIDCDDVPLDPGVDRLLDRELLRADNGGRLCATKHLFSGVFIRGYDREPLPATARS